MTDAACSPFSWCPREAVHVIPGSQPCLTALVADTLAAHEGAAIVLGTASEADVARSLGVKVIDAVCPPLGEALLGARALGRSLARSRVLKGPIVAWGLDAFAATLRATPATNITAVLADGGASPASEFVLRMDGRRRECRVVTFSRDVSARFEALFSTSIDVVERPRVALGRLVTDRRSIRRRWDVRDDECAIGLLGEPADRADVRRLAELVGIAAVRGERVRLILHPDAARRQATEAWLSGIDVRPFLVLDSRLARPWEVVAGLDVACVSADAAVRAGRAGFGSRLRGLGGLFQGRPGPVSPLPALWAVAAEVPLLIESGAFEVELRDAPHSSTWTDEDSVLVTRRIVEIARAVAARWSPVGPLTPTLCATPA